MSSSGPRLDKALSYISTARGIGGFGENFIAGLSGLVLFFFTALMGIGESVVNLFVAPTDATAGVTVVLIEAGFGAPAKFLQDAWNMAAVALGMDPWLSLGPFLIMVAIIPFLGTLTAILYWMDWVDVDTLSGLEFPWIGRDETDLADGEDT